LAQSWLRQAFGAAGASLLAPLAILLAAGALASGGGLGGLSELGQIASGPTLPGGELAAEGPAIVDADIVGANLDGTGSLGGAGTPSGGTTIGAPDVSAGAPGGSAPLPSPLLNVPPSPVGGGGGVNPGPLVEPVAPSAPVPGGGPAGELVETTRGLPMVVPESIRPVTEDVINLLLGPPQP
jgi:hypothetical protein